MNKIELINAEEGFFELFHLVKELELYLNYGKGEGHLRRKSDSYLKDFNDRLDNIYLKHIKGINDKGNS